MVVLSLHLFCNLRSTCIFALGHPEVWVLALFLVIGDVHFVLILVLGHGSLILAVAFRVVFGVEGFRGDMDLRGHFGGCLSTGVEKQTRVSGCHGSMVRGADGRMLASGRRGGCRWAWLQDGVVTVGGK
ncbi:hypothetical protein HDK77DRAFT_446540 [Phyllosticta capitalensis]